MKSKPLIDSRLQAKGKQSKNNILNAKSKVDTWGKTARPTTERGIKQKHNFSKTSGLNSEVSSNHNPESSKHIEGYVSLEPLPFYDMLKEFNKHQDEVIQSIKIYNKDSSKNKYQLK